MSSAAALAVCLALQIPALSRGWPSGEQPSELPFVYQTWQTFTTSDGLPHDEILAIHVSSEQVWVGTAGGLGLRERDGWRSWTEHDGLPWPVITAIDVDARTQDVWLGTWGGGLIRFSGGRFHQFDQLNSGLAGNLVFAVAVTGDRVWAATNAGLSSLDTVHGMWELYFERRADAPETVITGLTFDGRSLHAGAWCGGLWRFVLPAGKWTRVEGPASDGITKPVPPDPLDDTTLAISVASESLWRTTQTNLLRRDDAGRWGIRGIAEPPVSGNLIRCLAARSDTEAWLGTDRGLHVLADWPTGTWVTYRRCENGAEGLATVSRNGRILDARVLKTAIPDNRIRCIALQKNDVWIGTVSGLARGMGGGRWAGLRPVPANSAVVGETTCKPAVGLASRPPPSDLEPGGVQVVNIGVLRPGQKTIALPGSDPSGATRLGQMDRLAVYLAVEQANARGGYRGRVPFALVTGPDGAFSGWGWTTPEDDFPALAQQPNVWGIVGYLGPASRITTAVALRTELPLVNVARTAPTIDETINPWIFRCPGNDPDRQEKLLDYIFDQRGHTGVAVLRTPGAQTRAHLDQWVRRARDIKRIRLVDIPYDPESGRLDPVLEAIQRNQAEVVLTWCDGDLSAVILRQMRQAGMTGLFVGSEHIVTDEFVRLVGADPGPIIALWDCSAVDDETARARFAEGYELRFKRSPKPEAFRSYDAARHLLRAIDLAGLDREAIRRTLQGMSTACVARLEDGRWTFRDSCDR